MRLVLDLVVAAVQCDTAVLFTEETGITVSIIALA